MKDNFKIIISVLLVLILVIGYSLKVKKINNEFKKEYESLNEKVNPNNDKKYLSIKIDEDNNIKYATASEIIDIIKNKTGVIYLGYPECPWCRNMVPVLIKAAKQTKIDNIYYLNVHDIRDKKSLNEDGEIIIEKKGTEGYKKILESLGDKASIYEGLNDESVKRIYVPLVIFVKDGEIITMHEGTVDSQKDPYVKLSKTEEKELLNIYKDNMYKINDNLCDSSC